VPSIEIRHATRKPAKSLVMVHGDGKEVALSDGLMKAEMRAKQFGERFVFLDLRGFGETAPVKSAPGRPSYFGTDFTESFLALHLARPLLGQRTYDLLSVFASLHEEVASPVEIVAGVGSAAPVALHAAFLNRDRTMFAADRLLLSWASVVRSPISLNQLTDVVPGALAVYDLSDLAETLPMLTIYFIGSLVDPKGEPIEEKEWPKVYRETVVQGLMDVNRWLFKKK
jgi:hypothetical protein